MNGEAGAEGLIPHICDALFNVLNSRSNDTMVVIKLSFMEIYNDECYDLLTDFDHLKKKSSSSTTTTTVGTKRSQQSSSKSRGTGLLLGGDARNGFNPKGLTERAVHSVSQVLDCVEVGNRNRAIASHNLNLKSSRSHAVLFLDISQTKSSSSKSKSATVLKSRLTLIDLAGSERTVRTGVEVGERMEELKHINKSLTTLGMCIKNLMPEAADADGGGGVRKGKAGKIGPPYRNSKLTQVLCRSLGGNARTAVLVAISPAPSDVDETVATLRFAERCRSLTTKAKQNMVSNEGSSGGGGGGGGGDDDAGGAGRGGRVVDEEIAAELAFLRSEVERLRTEKKTGDDDSARWVNLLELKVAALQTQLGNSGGGSSSSLWDAAVKKSSKSLAATAGQQQPSPSAQRGTRALWQQHPPLGSLAFA